MLNGELPAPMVFGDNEVMLGLVSPGTGVVSVSGDEFDVPNEFATVTEAVPGNTAAVYGIEAVSSVALTKAVGCAPPFQLTVESLVKFAP